MALDTLGQTQADVVALKILTLALGVYVKALSNNPNFNVELKGVLQRSVGVWVVDAPDLEGERAFKDSVLQIGNGLIDQIG